MRLGFDEYNCIKFTDAAEFNSEITVSVIESTAWISTIEGSTAVNIKYVHQLQNLYFALTGEELTLNK